MPLAFRNVLRNKRRSLITLLSIFAGGLLVTSMRFLTYGSHQQMLDNSLSLSTGYMQVAAYGWLENRSLERALEVDESLLSSLRSSGVTAISPRMEGFALAAREDHSVFATVTAADPQLEKKITDLHTYLLQGRYLDQLPDLSGVPAASGVSGLPVAPELSANQQQPQPPGGRHRYPAIIGEILAQDLDAALGSEVSLVSSQFDGTVGAILVEVVGIYKTFDLEFDARRVFIDLPAGEELFGLGAASPDVSLEMSYDAERATEYEAERDVDRGADAREFASRQSRQGGIKRYTSLALGATDHLSAERIYEEISSKYPPPALEGDPGRSDSYMPVVHFWPELVPDIVELLQFDAIQNEITLSFLLLVMAFGVLNTVQMSIQERLREFGILMALGTRQGQLLLLLIMETLILILPGLTLGALAGTLCGYWLQENPIQISADLSQAYADLGFQLVEIGALVSLRQLWIAIASLLLPSLLFAIIAGRRVYKISPAQVIASF